MAYTKLFSSITTSTIWREDDHTRLVWITMLAMADKHGIVISSLPGLSDMARVSIEGTLAALEKLGSPDKWSSTQEHEGRRIEKIDRGWRLLNYVKFRDMRDEVERNEYMKNLMRERRAKEKVAKAVSQSVSSVSDVSDRKHPLAYASAAASASAVDSKAAPEDFHPLQYAHRMIEILSMPNTQANMRVIEAAITAEAKFTGASLEESAQSIADHAMKARKSGVAIDKFWFEDTKWRNGNGAKASAAATRSQRSKEAILEGITADARRRASSDDGEREGRAG